MKKYLSSCVLCILIAISPSSSFGGSTEDAANNAIAWLQSIRKILFRTLFQAWDLITRPLPIIRLIIITFSVTDLLPGNIQAMI